MLIVEIVINVVLKSTVRRVVPTREKRWLAFTYPACLYVCPHVSDRLQLDGFA